MEEDATAIPVAEYLALHPAGLRIEDFLRLARLMALQVAEFHAGGWIHGEVTPASFVVRGPARNASEHGELPGVRVVLLPSTRPTATDAVPRVVTDADGPLHYVAPERTGRMQIPFDHRVDLYSLGATFYEMLVGTTPFPAGDPVSVLHAHVAIVPPAPRVRKASIPKVVSDLVMRLLEKMPEFRYQAATAVADDLKEAEARVHASGGVEDFELGLTDPGRKFGEPRALYGREEEQQALHEALFRCTRGGTEFMLISGPAGIGKTALAQRALSGHSWVGASQFGGFQASRPYATIADAVRDLLHRLMDAPIEIRARVASRARSALSGGGRTLRPLIPELELLTGVLPPLAAQDFEGGDPRTRLSLRALLRALASPELPVVLFFDDLHWADATSIDFIDSLIEGGDISHLFVVGSARSDALNDSPRLSRLRELNATDGPFRELKLSPLGPSALTALCADLLHTDERTVAPLAALVADKATGNPLFVERFLWQLKRAGAIHVDVIRRTCSYSPARVATVEVPDDIVDLMGLTVRSLPAPIRRVLAVAAAFRETFAAVDLRGLTNEPTDDIEAYLLTARAEGLLLLASDGRGEPAAVYRFLHDRVKQAAYDCLDSESRAEIHLAIGLRLVDALEDPKTDERLFEALDHLGRGSRLLRDKAARLRLVDLYREAGQRAKASSGFNASYDYFRSALALLPEDAALSHRAVFLELLHGAVSCGFLSGEVDSADRLAREASQGLSDALDRAELLRLRVIGLTSADRLEDAIACVRQAALILGCHLPEGHDNARVRAEVLELGDHVSTLSPAGFKTLPELTDSRLLLLVRVLSAANGATWLRGDTALFAAAQARMVSITIQEGLAPESGGALVRFGAMYADAIGDPRPAYEISVHGLGLSLEATDLRTRCRARFGMAFHISHLRLPLQACVDEFRAVIDLGVDCGEFAYVGFASHREIEAALTMGQDLPTVLRELDRARVFAQRHELKTILKDLSALRGVVHCLQGRADTHDLLTDDATDLIRGRTELFARLSVWMLGASYLFRRLEAANRYARTAEPLLRMMPSTLPVMAYVFYDALCRVAVVEEPSEETASELRVVEEHAARLELWAKSCPDNFTHKALLVRAELARARGLSDEAMRGYADAAAASRAQQAQPDEAIAIELAGRLHWKLGRSTMARAAIRDAMRLFARWGSLGKVEALAVEFLGYAEKPSTFGATLVGASAVTAAHLDLLSVMKMVESVSSELVPERLFERLVLLGLEVASAQNAVLILREGRNYEVRARGSASEGVVLLRTSLEENADFPRAMLRAVIEQSAAIRVGDLQNDPVYGVDDYVRSAAVKSAMAIPICRENDTIGALYLESRLVSGAFAEDRVAVLELLSSQMTISLENARLFERLESEVQERRRAEARLQFLAEASLRLADRDETDTVFEKVASIAVPFLADWATVDALVEDGTLNRMAGVHADPRMQELLDELSDRYPPAANSSVPAATALRTGKSLLLAEVTDSSIRRVQADARHGELLRRLGNRSTIAVPLTSHGRKLGALTLHVGGSRPRFAESDVQLAEELARRGALAIHRARLETRLAQSQKLEAIGRLAAGVAHDFNNLLMLILGHADLLSLDTALGEDNATSVQQIKEAGVAAAAIVKRLLALGRRQVLNPEVLRVNDCLEALADMLRGLGGARVDLVLELDPEVGEINIDRSQLIQVLVNLVTNARDAMPSGGTIFIRTSHRTFESSLDEPAAEQTGAHTQVCISVSDTGVGMDPKTRAHLFEPFFTTKPSGTGIGLATVSAIVEQSGGRIFVDSRPGAGSRFTSCLPKLHDPGAN
ncbi:MAG TPA: AAA family ATPase [Polyangiaceae bacterium]|nr:AAA family ATPase [Polyangiaceae bacterium]